MPVLPSAESHPTSCMMDTWCFPGTKRPGLAVDHPPPSSSEFANGLEVYLHFPSVHTEVCNGTTFTFTRFFTTVLYFVHCGLVVRVSGYRYRGLGVRFPALPDFLSSSGSGTGSTQLREVN